MHLHSEVPPWNKQQQQHVFYQSLGKTGLPSCHHCLLSVAPVGTRLHHSAVTAPFLFTHARTGDLLNHVAPGMCGLLSSHLQAFLPSHCMLYHSWCIIMKISSSFVGMGTAFEGSHAKHHAVYSSKPMQAKMQSACTQHWCKLDDVKYYYNCTYSVCIWAFYASHIVPTINYKLQPFLSARADIQQNVFAFQFHIVMIRLFKSHMIIIFL